MVHMIPEALPREVLSSAEKRLFRQFSAFETDEEIVVIHSFSMARHQANIFGEIDFLVICREGVLVLEVKGGGVSRENGLWSYTNRYGDDTVNEKSPFDQAVGNMGSLRGFVKKQYGDSSLYAQTQYACAVIMPDCSFPYRGAGIIPEVLFDRDSSLDLRNIIDTSFSYWRRKVWEQHGITPKRLYDDRVLELARELRGDFSFVPSLSISINRAEKRMVALTEAQHYALEVMEDNPRILVSGTAGTGKSLLAMEKAHREAVRGRTVLYVCFNRNMAEFASYFFQQNETPSVRADTFHNVLMDYFPEDRESDLPDGYFSEILPKKFRDYRGSITQYDTVIVDEAQDLLDGRYLECLDRLVVKGWKYGSWCIFFDPRQNIYGDDRGMESIRAKLEKFSVKCRLTKNCRNTREIVGKNVELTGIEQDTKVQVEGPEVSVEAFSSVEEEREKVIEIIRRLRREGIPISDIVVLSQYAEWNVKSVFHDWRPDKDINGRFVYNRSVWMPEVNTLRGSTVASFKGLESKVVILCDVNGFTKDHKKRLNYIGISRAKSALFILCDRNAEDDLKALREEQ